MMPYDFAGQHRLDSLSSRLTIADSSDRQSVRQYTIGATGTFHQNDRWTHTAVVGVDGYRLKTASILDGAFPSAIDSVHFVAATGSALRASLRAPAASLNLVTKEKASATKSRLRPSIRMCGMSLGTPGLFEDEMLKIWSAPIPLAVASVETGAQTRD